ncbi:MAG: ribonuclease H family protein, partial [Malacoplasma sp.]|nr:ribonuclease H family protein [Malacoplasma sp.]
IIVYVLFFLFMSKKYYSVAVGRKIGIFNNWKDCQESVIGFKNAIYKSFSTLEEAKLFLFNFKKSNKEISDELINDIQVKNSVKLDLKENIYPIFVDGSFNKKNQKIGYGILIINGLNSNN